MPRRGTNGDDARVRARRAFNRLYRAHRLAAEAAGLPFPTYNEMVQLLTVEMRERGQVSLDRTDVEQIFDRMTRD